MNYELSTMNYELKKMKRITLAISIILFVLLLDQSLKVWVKLNMRIGESIAVFDWFKLYFTENKGMAFGLSFGGDYGKLFLSIFRIFAVTLLSWYVVKLIREKAPMGLIAGLSMIIAGALGNIVDSAFYGLLFSSSFHSVATFMPEAGGYSAFLHGRVVDMLYLPVYHGYLPEWLGGKYVEFFRPIFNIADVAITTGVFSLIIFQRSFFKALDDRRAQYEMQSVEEVEM